MPNTESLFSIHPRDRIASCVEYIEEMSGKKPILNKAGYLIKMLNVAATASPRATPVPAQAQPARTGKATLLGDLIAEGGGFSYDPLSPLKKELRSMKVPGYASGTIVAAAVSETLRLHPRHQAVYDTCIQDSTAFPRRFIRVCIPILKKHARDFIPPSQR